MGDAGIILARQTEDKELQALRTLSTPKVFFFNLKKKIPTCGIAVLDVICTRLKERAVGYTNKTTENR